MKKILTLFAVLLLGAVATTNAKAQDLPFSACLRDNFGYTWNFLAVAHKGDLNIGFGTVDIGEGVTWRASGTYNATTGEINLKATNPDADGCASGYTDYFTYTGTGSGGRSSFYASGTWNSYCSGSVINSGTWSAADCKHSAGKVDPNGPAKTKVGQPLPFSACLRDNFGYTWNFLAVGHKGDLNLGFGTVDIGDGDIWRASGSYNASTGEINLKATNPDADGCASGYTDFFTYTGTGAGDRSYFTASGTWNSYCSGSVINSGTWSATDCDHSAAGKANPNGPAKHAGESLMKVSPNPINSSANISYSVAKAGRVNITVYNSLQQTVKVLVNEFKNAGKYSTTWNTMSGSVNAGVYRIVTLVDGKTYSTTVQVVR